MKAAFSIEGEGFDENEEEDRESLLRDFIGYIKVILKYGELHYTHTHRVNAMIK